MTLKTITFSLANYQMSIDKIFNQLKKYYFSKKYYLPCDRMSTIAQLKREFKLHNRSQSQLSQSFYRKINKRYSSPTQGINRTIIQDKLTKQKQVILSAIEEEMGKELSKLPFLKHPQQWMTFGMIKNRMYCRKRGDHFSDRSLENLESIQSEFIICEYQKRMKSIGDRIKTERACSISSRVQVPEQPKLPRIKSIKNLRPKVIIN